MNDLQFLGTMMGNADPAILQKALTTASGFVGVNLEPTARLMLPLFAGLRNRMPVDTNTGPMGDTTVQWRMQLGYGGFDFGGNMGTAYGGNGGALAGTAATIAANYASQSVNGSVEFEAIPAARGFDDPLAIETSRGLASLVRLDELMTLGGNRAAIAAPAPVAGVAAPAGAVFAAGVWSIQVTALTKQGMLTNAAADSHVGESAPSAILGYVVPAGGATYLEVTWPAIPGAFGYKIYCSAVVGDGAPIQCLRSELAYIDATTTALSLTTGRTIGITGVRITTPPPAGRPAPVAGDGSVSALQFEGLAAWCEKTTIYGTAVGAHANIDLVGAPLTVGAAGIVQFDTILANLWSTWNISPSLIVTSPNGAAAVTAALMGATGILNYWINASQNQGNLTGGVYVGGYTNKFAGSMLPNQKTVIPVWAHPYVDDGTFLFLSETVPYQYSREARGFALDVQTPYTYFELGRTTRTFPFDIFFTETLKCYIPPAQAAIQGARVE